MEKPQDALLRQFNRLASEAFAFLVSDYGFERVEAKAHMPEMRIVFRNSTTQVTVTFELGTGVWTKISALTVRDAKTIEGDGYDLSFLLKVRAPGKIADFRLTDFDEEKVKLAVSEQAAALKEYGADVLRGDFGVFPEIDKLATDNLRRREETLFHKAES